MSNLVQTLLKMKPITVWGHWGGPNPWKVRIILRELGIPHEYRIVEFAETKQEPYININPNGRLPAIEDPNTGVVLWESAAIILYLIEQYDTEGRISYQDMEKFQCIKWLMFQASGQGPYFGQLAWFLRFHQEKLPSAIERYANEMERVFGVLDKSIGESGWLVGDKCTYADLSFVTWSHVAIGMVRQLGKTEMMEKFPKYNRWFEAMESRESVRESLNDIVAARAAHSLPP